MAQTSYLGNKTHLEQNTVPSSWLYFRNVADEDDDDDRAASISIPAGEVTGFHMQSATILKIYYNQDHLTEPNVVFLTVTSGKGLDVLKALVDEMNVPN